MNYVTAKEAREFFKCSNTSLMNWKRSGLIKTRKITERKILYDIDSYKTPEDNIYNRKNYIYARVSNTKQSDDLDNQIEVLKKYCSTNGIKLDGVYKDIASGMNENRNDFNKLIDRVIRGDVDTVFITYKDRLTRFGFEYFKRLFLKYDTKIFVLAESEESDKSFQDELTEDLISIIHRYSMKLCSNRRKRFKEIEDIISCKED